MTEFDALIEAIQHHENEIITDGEYMCSLLSQLIPTTKLWARAKD